MKHSAFILALLLTLVGCSQFSDPSPADAAPILGCFRAAGAPSLLIDGHGMKIGGRGEIVPYQYGSHKIGMMLRVPLSAEIKDQRFTLQHSDDHLFRVLFDNGKPIIRVAFGPNGTLVDYHLEADLRCSG